MTILTPQPNGDRPGTGPVGFSSGPGAAGFSASSGSAGAEPHWELLTDPPSGPGRSARRSAVPQLLTALGLVLVVLGSVGATTQILSGSGFFGVLGLISLGVLSLVLVLASAITAIRVRAHRRAQLVLTALAVVLNPLTVFIATGIISTLFG